MVVVGWVLGVISDKYARGLPDRPVIKVAFVKCEKQGLDTSDA